MCKHCECKHSLDDVNVDELSLPELKRFVTKVLERFPHVFRMMVKEPGHFETPPTFYNLIKWTSGGWLFLGSDLGEKKRFYTIEQAKAEREHILATTLARREDIKIVIEVKEGDL